MQTGLSQLFDLYNLYGKAFPGILFLILSVLALPQELVTSNLPTSSTAVGVVVLLAIVLGFVLGQAIHSISVFIESTVFETIRDYYRMLVTIASGIRDLISSLKSGFQLKDVDVGSLRLPIPSIFAFIRVLIATYAGLISLVILLENRVAFLVLLASLFGGILLGALIDHIGPVNKSREFIKSVLTPHRRLFKQRLSENDELVEEFNNKFKHKFDWDPEDRETKYMAVMSHLELSRQGRARMFQAIFSFSRSMWVLLLFYSLLFLLIGTSFQVPELLPEFIRTVVTRLSEHDPAISTLMSDDSVDDFLVYLSSFMLVFAILFLYTEAQYKKLFTGYFIADFINTASDNDSKEQRR